jgi:hypothetical protein
MNAEQRRGFGDLGSRSGGTVGAKENGDETCKLGQHGSEAHVIEIIMVGQFVSDPTNQVYDRSELKI